MEKIKMDLEIILPTIPDERDACVQRLIELLHKRKGIEKVHVIPPSDRKALLCFHYDPDVISLTEIQQYAKESGAAVTKQYGHLLIEIQAFRDLDEAKAIENELRVVKGIEEISVSATGNIRLEFDRDTLTQEAVRAAVEQAGGTIVKVQKNEHAHDHSGEEAKHDHHHDEHPDDDGHHHDGEPAGWKGYLPAIVSLVLLLLGIACDRFIHPAFFKDGVRLVWYAAAYLPVGAPVAWKGIRLALKGDIFTEFILMTIATTGAFYVGEYPEGVAVMLFYNIGELFQDAAVNRAKRSIKALLDIRPNQAFVKRNGEITAIDPQQVQLDEIIQIKAGEKVPLDGELLSDSTAFNAAALTGESVPITVSQGEQVLAGMINMGKVVEVKVTKLFNDSSLARILYMVQEATTRKAQTEQFIRKFSRVYTPVVVSLAIGITLLPYLFVDQYSFNDWLYRALIFLVISCPCALVISIPLGYFGGIGAASRNGILFKGSNFLDLMTRVNTVVMDKTGTLTKGVFKVQEVVSAGLPQEEWLPMAGAMEAQSTHPIAKAVVDYVGDKAKGIEIGELEEISGHGLKTTINGKLVWAGNARLMEKAGITLDENAKAVTDTIVLVGVDDQLAGYITIADEIKEDSRQAVNALHQLGVKTVMLSGDKQAVVDKVAKALNIDEAFGGLLPENKVEKVATLKQDKRCKIAFVGDGINDAPVLAVSDVGMAMGGLGSDAAIETADVVIQTDQPSKIALSMGIARTTKRIVWQNIILAFIVKAIVLVLGAGGIATMWEAVFADVGVALLAILNAVRVQRRKFQ